MDNTSPRPSAGVFLSLPMSIGLLVLFFMPWLTLSCDPGAVTQAPEFRGAADLPKEFTEPTVLAHASGWDLARGELTPGERFKREARGAQENEEGPPAKPWAYGGLVLPGLLVILALLCLFGRLTSPGTGKWMLLLGIAGVVLMLVAASVDYVDEAMDQAKEEMRAHGMRPGCRAFELNMAEAVSKTKEVIQTKATAYLWGCLVLYGLIGLCGLAAIGASEYVRPSQSVAWKQNKAGTGRDPASLSAVPDPTMWAPRRQFGFGPDITPEEAPAPAAGDEADSQA